MRIGFNPNKDKIQSVSGYFHQVIIPVYIPHQEGYFKDSFAILKLCLSSLFKTCHDKTYITIVNNGSCQEIESYLNKLYHNKVIHEIINTTAIGKLNAILKGIVGHSFRLITISDADVLFMNNWQTETYKVYNFFPKAGIVGTTPNSKLLKEYTGPTLLDNLFSKNVKFTTVKNPSAMQKFAKSINNISAFKSVNFEKNLTVSTLNNFKAVVGSGHFVATYKSDIFDILHHTKTNFSLGGTSENLFLDKPAENLGYWRLSTEDNYTFHMGNSLEDWMLKKVNELKVNDLSFYEIPGLSTIKSNTYVNWFKNKVLLRILYKKFIWKLFLRYKGLSIYEAKNY